MKLTYTFKLWYWEAKFEEWEERPPQWWLTFLEKVPLQLIVVELEKYADVFTDKGATVKIVFKSTYDLTFFILKYS
jgi:hypothetical protein